MGESRLWVVDPATPHADEQARLFGLLEELVAECAAPLAVGFGIRDARDVAAVLNAGARIAVVGSALARTIEEHANAASHVDALVRAVAEQIGELAGGIPASVPTSAQGDPSCSC